LRLGFAEPPTNPVLPELGGAIVSETMAAEPMDAPPVPEETPMPTPPPAMPEPAKSEGMPLLSVANAAALPIETPRLPQPELPSEVIAVATPESSAAAWTTVVHPSVDPRDALEAVPASAPPPPADSTAALVWRAPTIERLPEKTAAVSDYVSIPVTSLSAYRGARVRLLTAGGKLVEGRVQQFDGVDVVMLVVRDGGSAEMRIPQAGIRDVKVRRSAIR
jgi:hypothetical protein